MCTYNGAAFIEQQLACIAGQSYPLHEIIIVDDASTDATFSLLQNWQQKNELIRLYRNPTNLGVHKNFEKAIRLATGDYISIADQDDIWLPEKTKLLAEALERHPESMLAHCRSATLKQGRLSYANHKLHRHFSGPDTRKLIFFNQVNGHGMMFKKKVLEQALPIPPGMFYDWWIAVVATTCGAVISVDKTLVHHRIHETNAHFTSGRPKSEPDHDEVIDHITTLATLNDETRCFAQALSTLIKENPSSNKNVNWRLFLFLFRHRRIIFGHKRRWAPLFSYLKNAIKYAKARYRHAGVSF